MLRLTPFGDITRFDLARTLAGRGRYWTTAYLVDGLLVDTGCAHSALELAAALADSRVDRIVNTHTHEDHIGANGLLQRQRRSRAGPGELRAGEPTLREWGGRQEEPFLGGNGATRGSREYERRREEAGLGIP